MFTFNRQRVFQNTTRAYYETPLAGKPSHFSLIDFIISLFRKPQNTSDTAPWSWQYGYGEPVYPSSWDKKRIEQWERRKKERPRYYI